MLSFLFERVVPLWDAFTTAEPSLNPDFRLWKLDVFGMRLCYDLIRLTPCMTMQLFDSDRRDRREE